MKIIENVLIYIQCCRKDNRKKYNQNSQSKQIDYYQFAMYNDTEHEELNCTIGYFKFTNNSINKRKYLFKVSANTINQAIDDFMNTYKYHIEEKNIVENDSFNGSWTIYNTCLTHNNGTE